MFLDCSTLPALAAALSNSLSLTTEVGSIVFINVNIAAISQGQDLSDNANARFWYCVIHSSNHFTTGFAKNLSYSLLYCCSCASVRLASNHCFCASIYSGNRHSLAAVACISLYSDGVRLPLLNLSRYACLFKSHSVDHQTYSKCHISPAPAVWYRHLALSIATWSALGALPLASYRSTAIPVSCLLPQGTATWCPAADNALAVSAGLASLNGIQNLLAIVFIVATWSLCHCHTTNQLHISSKALCKLGEATESICITLPDALVTFVKLPLGATDDQGIQATLQAHT